MEIKQTNKHHPNKINKFRMGWQRFKLRKTNIRLHYRKKSRNYIEGEDIPEEVREKSNRKTFSKVLAVTTFVATILGTNLLTHLVFAVFGFENGFLTFGDGSPVRFRLYWLFRIRFPLIHLLSIPLAVWLMISVYRKASRRIESLAYGQKGDNRLMTLKEIKARYTKIPASKETFEGMGGMVISHHAGKHYIDRDTSNTLILGTSRIGKGETLVVPVIDNISRGTKQCSMIIGDTKGELYAGSKETLEARGYEVQALNLLDPMQGMSFNPLQLIVDSWRNGDKPTAEMLVATFSYALFNNPQAGQNKWVYECAQDLFNGVVLAMIDECDKNNELEKVTMYNLGQMITELSSQKFTTPSGIEKDGLDKYFAKLPQGHIAKAQYASAMVAGEKAKASILQTVTKSLRIFQTEPIAKMTSTNSFDLKSVGFPRSMEFQFDESLAYKNLVVKFIRQGQVIGTYNIRPNLSGNVGLNFKTEVKTGDHLEITLLVKQCEKQEKLEKLLQPKSGEETEIKLNELVESSYKITYKIERKVDELTEQTGDESVYEKAVTLHPLRDTLRVRKIQDEKAVKKIATHCLTKRIEMKITDKPIAVFLIVPDYDPSRNVIASTFIKQLYTTLAKEASLSGGKCHRRVHFILDEFGNLPAIEGMENILTVCLGRNILFHLFIQNFKQLNTVYNENIAETIIENSQNIIYLKSVHVDTQRRISEWVGNRTVESLSVSEKEMEMSTSQTRQAVEERILPTERVGGTIRGESIVLSALKLLDNEGNKVRAFPIFNTKETALPFRYEYLADDFDTSKSLNDFTIPSIHKHFSLESNQLNYELLIQETSEKADKKGDVLKLTEKLVRKYLLDQTNLTQKQVDYIFEKKKIS